MAIKSYFTYLQNMLPCIENYTARYRLIAKALSPEIALSPGVGTEELPNSESERVES